MRAVKSLATIMAAGAGLAVATSSMTPVQAFSLTNAQSSGYQKGQDVGGGPNGNKASSLLNEDNIFGDGEWSFAVKEDESEVEQEQNVGLQLEGLGTSSGTLGFDNVDFNSTDLAISLKAGNAFSLYHIEAGSLSSGESIDWSTDIDLDGKDLSHASVFVRDNLNQNEDEASQSIPEPGTGIALGMVALGAFAYKRKSQDASQ